jgi:hypothetical protein
MTFQIKKTINCDTHNVSRALPGKFVSRAAATRAIKKLWRVEGRRYDIPSEHCYSIVDARTGRQVGFVYPTGPWLAPDHGGDDIPF